MSKKQNFSKQYDYLFKYRTKEDKRLSRTTFDVLFFLITKGEMYNFNHKAKIRNKSHADDMYHFYCSFKEIATNLDTSIKTVQRATNELENIGLINKYQSIRTSKWYINYQLLSEIENQILNNPTPPKTEQQIINEEIETSINETINSMQDYKEVTTELLETEKLEAMNVIMTNVDNEVLSNNEVEQLDNVINTYNTKIENVNTSMNTTVNDLTSIKRKIHEDLKNITPKIDKNRFGYSRDDFYNIQIECLKKLFSKLDVIKDKKDIAKIFIENDCDMLWNLQYDEWYILYVLRIWNELISNNLVKP